MAQFAQYRVSLLDWTGEKILTLFPGTDFLGMSWEHKRNKPGSYRLDLVGEATTKDRFIKHYQVLVERNWGSDPADWYTEFVGFHLGLEESWPTSDIDEHYWSSLGLSPEWLLDQPLLQPVRNIGNADWEYYDLWWYYGAGDDAIKLMVAESLTNPVDADRAFTQVSLQGNSTQGVYNAYEGKWIRLLDGMINAIGEDGTKGGCDFRVERVSGGYEFRTYAPFYGTDRRRGNAYGNKPVVFSFENGNVKNLQRRVLWADAVTAAYGGWQGSGLDRTISLRENATALAESPFSRREEFYNLDVAQAGVIDSILDQKLIDDGQKEYVTAEIMQTDACLYGRDWRYGDLTTLDLPGGLSYPMRIVQTAGRISSENEEEIGGAIELWTREETV